MIACAFSPRALMLPDFVLNSVNDGVDLVLGDDVVFERDPPEDVDGAAERRQQGFTLRVPKDEVHSEVRGRTIVYCRQVAVACQETAQGCVKVSSEALSV